MRQEVAGNDYTWDYRAPRLFDLRSSLVHGATVAISDWNKLVAYRRHTKSDPSDDIATAVMAALRQYPNNYPSLRSIKPKRVFLRCALALLAGVFVGKRLSLKTS
ncbi:MAG TPA: hypothetical protein VJ180_12945 [Pyrinomonadaceae bacterium]|nr:hypothetical protein [Pyrinomonadaceae bacterium]